MSQNKILLPAYKGSLPYVFVSYAHKDLDLVLPILELMNASKCNIWYDEGIDPGNEWPDEIAKALQGCTLFIAFISKNSIASKNVINEINYALTKSKSILVIHIEETILPEGLQLQIGSNQAILQWKMDLASFAEKLLSSIQLRNINLDYQSGREFAKQLNKKMHVKRRKLIFFSLAFYLVVLTILIVIISKKIATHNQSFMPPPRDTESRAVITDSPVNQDSSAEATDYPMSGMEVLVNGVKTYYYADIQMSDSITISCFANKKDYENYLDNNEYTYGYGYLGSLIKDSLYFYINHDVNNYFGGTIDQGDELLLSNDVSKTSNMVCADYANQYGDVYDFQYDSGSYSYTDYSSGSSEAVNSTNLYELKLTVTSYNSDSGKLMGTLSGYITTPDNQTINFADGKFVLT